MLPGTVCTVGNGRLAWGCRYPTAAGSLAGHLASHLVHEVAHVGLRRKAPRQTCAVLSAQTRLPAGGCWQICPGIPDSAPGCATVPSGAGAVSAPRAPVACGPASLSPRGPPEPDWPPASSSSVVTATRVTKSPNQFCPSKPAPDKRRARGSPGSPRRQAVPQRSWGRRTNYR